jgi:hypothetical protein
MGAEECGTRAAATPPTRVHGPSIVTRPLASGSAEPPSAISSDARESRSKFLACSASPLMRKIGFPLSKATVTNEPQG